MDFHKTIDRQSFEGGAQVFTAITRTSVRKNRDTITRIRDLFKEEYVEQY